MASRATRLPFWRASSCSGINQRLVLRNSSSVSGSDRIGDVIDNDTVPRTVRPVARPSSTGTGSVGTWRVSSAILSSIASFASGDARDVVWHRYERGHDAENEALDHDSSRGSPVAPAADAYKTESAARAMTPS